MEKKTLAEFLDEKKERKQVHRDYYPKDLFEHDPRKYCPDCLGTAKALQTHNVDGYDFECVNCKLNYTLFPSYE